MDLTHAVCKAGVTLRLGAEVSAEDILDTKPDAVIVAVGASSFAPPIPGKNGPNVADAWAVLAGEQQVYGRVAVIGGGMVGCETAEYLAGHGCKVSIVEMMDKIAAGESTTILPTLMENYKTLGVEQYPGHTVKAITMDTLVCEDKEGGEVLIPCDYVVMAVGARPAHSMHRRWKTQAYPWCGWATVRIRRRTFPMPSKPHTMQPVRCKEQ